MSAIVNNSKSALEAQARFRKICEDNPVKKYDVSEQALRCYCTAIIKEWVSGAADICEETLGTLDKLQKAQDEIAKLNRITYYGNQLRVLSKQITG